jgi:hypothetical protein
MQTIYRTNNITDAYLVKGLLQQDGIASHIFGEYLTGGVGELSAGDFIYLRVAPDSVDAALALISDFESGTLEFTATEEHVPDELEAGDEFEA